MTRKKRKPLSVGVKSSRYLDEFILSRCSADLIAAKMFPNAKEITESFAAFRAVRDLLGTPSFGDESITLVDVACGAKPRTAALFACMSRWQTIGIDPAVRVESDNHRIRRVRTIKRPIQDCRLSFDGLVVVTAVHAHVKLRWVIEALSAPAMVLVAMPCCQPLELPQPPTAEYDDWGCWSPKRQVRVWDMREAA
jgi:hypothetical protein